MASEKIISFAEAPAMGKMASATIREIRVIRG